MNQNQTWELIVSLKNVGPSKYRRGLTRESEIAGNTITCRTRLFVKGFSQNEGIYHGESFTPAARYNSPPNIWALANEMYLGFSQKDAVTAFLNVPSVVEVHMGRPNMLEHGTC